MAEVGDAVTLVDLSGYSIMSSFARSTQSARMLAFLLRIDGVDRRAVDFKEDEAPNTLEIKAFVTQLQAFLNAGGLGNLHAAPREFLELLGGLRSSRCLFLLKQASAENPELGDQLEKLLAEAGSVLALSLRAGGYPLSGGGTEAVDRPAIQPVSCSPGRSRPSPNRCD